MRSWRGLGHRGGVRPSLAIVGAAALLACERGAVEAQPDTATVITDDGSAYWPAAEWRTARPRDVGLDAKTMASLASRFRTGQLANLHGLVVVRHGYVVVDEYANGSSATHVHTLQSVTKSITSLLVGIAVDRGLMQLGERLVDVFPEYPDLQHLDERKRSATIGDLLTMRSGIDFWESPYPGSPLQQLNDSRGDWVRMVLDRPMNGVPGERWQYNSGGVIVLGGAIYNRAGMAADEFARRYLFDPIGVTTATWARGNPNGIPHLGGGLSLRARDLARIGYLVLRKGRWGDSQVVSEAWLEQSTAPVVRAPRTFGSHATDYGYLWWPMPISGAASSGWDHDVIAASGALGQWLFIVPKYDLVVVVTGNAQAFQDFIRPLDFLYSDILAAVR